MTLANSQDAESVHSWSTNSRWIVFASRRDDGQFTRPYFCHVSADGEVSKAFMLPQESPKTFYDNRFMSYNIPEFVTSPLQIDGKKAEELLLKSERKPMRERLTK